MRVRDRKGQRFEQVIKVGGHSKRFSLENPIYAREEVRGKPSSNSNLAGETCET